MHEIRNERTVHIAQISLNEIGEKGNTTSPMVQTISLYKIDEIKHDLME